MLLWEGIGLNIEPLEEHGETIPTPQANELTEVWSGRCRLGRKVVVLGRSAGLEGSLDGFQAQP